MHQGFQKMSILYNIDLLNIDLILPCFAHTFTETTDLDA